MPSDITMRGLLEPVRIEEGFVEAIQTLNMASAQGKEFVVATSDEDGEHIAMSARNILLVKGVEEDEVLA